MELIITSIEDLQMIIDDSIKKAIDTFIPREVDEKSNLSMDDAVQFLAQIGYPVSKSQLYKKTMKRSIPFQRFGAKKIVFEKSALHNWAKNCCLTCENPEAKITLTLANSANKKLKSGRR